MRDTDSWELSGRAGRAPARPHCAAVGRWAAGEEEDEHRRAGRKKGTGKKRAEKRRASGPGRSSERSDPSHAV